MSYKECMKNHAASIGGHALDGCCEFMPGPTANLLDPTSLTCAACGCHRNFHRRDPDDPAPLHHLIPPSAARRAHSPPSASQLLLSLSGHAQSPSGPSDHEMMQTPTTVGSGGGGIVMGYYTSNNGVGSGGQNGSFQSKKRFRTKFSQDQKEKMYEFSEKIGWRLKKGEEKLVQDFCKEVGVDRCVFKVWMHNNKHSASPSAIAIATASATVIPTATATATGSATVSGAALALASSQRNDNTGISTATTSITTSSNGKHGNTNNSSNNNNNNTNNSNVGMNCGGVLGSALEFNFANGGGQEAKAQ